MHLFSHIDKPSPSDNSDKAISYLLQAVHKMEMHCQKTGVKPGVSENISSVKHLIQKIKIHDKAKTIGFFGAQKRGKTTLINQLLGIDLLPIGTVPMSSVVIKVKNDNSHSKDVFTVDIIFKDGRMEKTPNTSLDKAQMLLILYATHKGSFSQEVDTIEVTSNFTESKILGNGGVLTDTPGAEIVFEQSENKTTQRNQQDTDRALKILEDTHIVVFVEGADYLLGKNSRQLFIEYLKPMRPLNVINKRDKYPSDAPDCTLAITERRLCTDMMQAYGTNIERTLCVSAKEAALAKKINDNALLHQSKLPDLEARILQELDNLKPEIGLLTSLQELRDILSKLSMAEAKEIVSNSKLALTNFIQTIQDELPEAAQIARSLYECFF